MNTTFPLPPAIASLIAARNALRSHYREILVARGSTLELSFTLDGNLVGDIGEALSVELFGIRLVDAKSVVGIDGYTPDGRTVQVKATGRGRGPAFRFTETRADHLLFFDLDFEGAVFLRRGPPDGGGGLTGIWPYGRPYGQSGHGGAGRGGHGPAASVDGCREAADRGREPCGSAAGGGDGEKERDFALAADDVAATAPRGATGREAGGGELRATHS
jgi:hypothetical protein